MAEEEAKTVPAEETEAPKEESKGPEYEGVVKGKYDWSSDAPTKKEADSDMAGEAITKYGWSDGKKTVSIYVELDGLDDVAEDALKIESGELEVTLTIGAIGTPPKKRSLKLSGLSNEIDGAKLNRKPGKNTVVIKLQKKEEKSWWKLLDSSSGGGGGDDDDEGGDMGGMGGMPGMGGMGGMPGMGGMGGMPGMGGMGGMDFSSMLGGMGGGMGM